MSDTPLKPDAAQLAHEVARRRTFAIISHPDAGKTTLTEKLLLYSGAIREAGSVSARMGGAAATSDWMSIEKERGISISSAAMQVHYDGMVLNLLDTPGHQDFSEDTYRTLTAADSAVMLLDAARGVQEQTVKLFTVSRERGIPIFTFINKLDRPAQDPYELLAEVERVLGIVAVPVTWPIGSGPDFKGVYERPTGRLHLYEGYPAADVVFPIELMHELGARSLVVTNACGGLDPNFRAGELMLQLDFINFTGQNPLIGPNDDSRYERFVVTYDAYDPGYLEVARAAALAEKILLREGVYLAISGPSYATRAELRAFRALGADAVGMSTVHEVLKARHLGMRVLGLSTITDMAVPDAGHHATGDEVLEMAAKSGETFRRLVRAVLPNL